MDCDMPGPKTMLGRKKGRGNCCATTRAKTEEAGISCRHISPRRLLLAREGWRGSGLYLLARAMVE